MSLLCAESACLYRRGLIGAYASTQWPHILFPRSQQRSWILDPAEVASCLDIRGLEKLSALAQQSHLQFMLFFLCYFRLEPEEVVSVWNVDPTSFNGGVLARHRSRFGPRYLQQSLGGRYGAKCTNGFPSNRQLVDA